MSSTRCTCLRDNLIREYPDPDCPAPSHRWDEQQEKDTVMRLRIAGEAPAILGGLQVLLAFLLSIDAFHLTSDTVALIMAAAAALSACVVAWATQHLVVGLVIGLVNTLVALFAGFGFSLDETRTAAVIGIVVFVFGLVNRQLTSPVTSDGVAAPGAVAVGAH